MNPLSESASDLNRTAMGDKKADMLLCNCRLVSVYTNEVIEGTDIAVSGGRIAYVGPDGSHTAGEKTRVVDAGKRYVTPGFADPHIHVDQFVTPHELARRLVLCGTTSVFSDPIDIVGVTGYRGFTEFVRMTRDLPVRFFHVVPGGVPVDRRFGHGRSMTPREEASAARQPGVVGLGEVFSWTKVILRDPATMKSISSMLERGLAVNGHTAGMSGKKLNAYVASGISSCHEPVSWEQVLERLRLGMWIMMREGTVRRDLAHIIPGLLGCGAHIDRLMFCSDGVDPVHVQERGHIDHCIRESVRLGMDAIDAIVIATRNCFDYYNMDELGGIAPGKIADMLVLDDLDAARPRDVYVGGKLTVSGGKLVVEPRKKRIPAWMGDTILLDKFSKKDFAVKSKSAVASANTISMVTEIITELGAAELAVKDGNVKASLDGDVWKVAAFERIFGTKKGTVGFLQNFGADIGAFASTWSFHENDLVVIGSDESDMAAAANALIRARGGMSLVRDGKLRTMPMRLGGIISTEPFERAMADFEGITGAITDAGCKFKRPHMIPLFLPFLALPAVRIMHGGIVDVKRRSLIPAIN